MPKLLFVAGVSFLALAWLLVKPSDSHAPLSAKTKRNNRVGMDLLRSSHAGQVLRYDQPEDQQIDHDLRRRSRTGFNVQQFNKMSTQYNELAQYLHGDANRARIIDEVLNYPGSIDTAKKVLISPRSINFDSNDQQAYARVFSIDLLAEASRRGSDQPLQEAIIKLQSLSVDGDEFVRGRQHDVVDLIVAWIDTHDKQEILDCPRSLLDELDYRKEFRKMYGTAIMYALAIDSNDTEVIERFRRSLGEGQ